MGKEKPGKIEVKKSEKKKEKKEDKVGFRQRKGGTLVLYMVPCL